MLGRMGAVLAAAIVLLGLPVVLLSAHYNPAIYTDFGGARFFLPLMLASPLMFGALVAVGIAYRRRPEVHRLLLGALLFVLHAAMTRRTSRYYAVGYASLAVGSLLSVVVAHSTTWNQIAALVAR